MLTLNPTYRPTITLQEPTKLVLHDNNVTRVVFSSDLISIGCTDITPEAAEYIIEEYRKVFPKIGQTRVHILQG